jgi:hypothetical protein
VKWQRHEGQDSSAFTLEQARALAGTGEILKVRFLQRKRTKFSLKMVYFSVILNGEFFHRLLNGIRQSLLVLLREGVLYV